MCLKKSFKPQLIWSPDSISRLNFNEGEVEAMFLFHFASFTIRKSQTYYRVNTFMFSVFDFKFMSVLNQTSRQDTAVGMIEFICDYKGIECPFLSSSPSWMKCEGNQTSFGTDYQEWCENCKNFNASNSCMDDIMTEMFTSAMLQFYMINEHMNKVGEFQAFKNSTFSPRACSGGPRNYFFS